MQKDRLNLYTLSMKYVRELSKADDRVMSISPQEHKENRPFVGVVVILDKKQYCIPLTSPKPKHKKMKNDLDFSKIFDKNGTLIGALNFNNMIPVFKDVIFPLNIKPQKNDPSRDKTYKELLNNQLDWCNENFDNITKKANKLYQFVTMTPEKSYNLTRRCCDFKKLEGVLEKWLAKAQIHNVPDELSQKAEAVKKCDEILNANPNLKAKLNKASVEYYRNHNLPLPDGSATVDERYEILRENPELKEEYVKAKNEYDKTHNQAQSQAKPKPKQHR